MGHNPPPALQNGGELSPIAITCGKLPCREPPFSESHQLQVGAIDPGAKVYWVAADKNVSTSGSGDTLIGAATQSAGSADAKVRVRLNGIAI
jgi:Uncharacterized conserved protein (DUF2190)